MWRGTYTNSGERTQGVGTKTPNELGLYDMSGNAWEWCSDWYDAGYYSVSPSFNPKGPSSGTDRVLRGGSWDQRRGLLPCCRPHSGILTIGYQRRRWLSLCQGLVVPLGTWVSYPLGHVGRRFMITNHPRLD